MWRLFQHLVSSPLPRLAVALLAVPTTIVYQKPKAGSASYACVYEDRLFVDDLSAPNAVLGSVFDGHGGMQVAEFLKTNLKHTFSKFYAEEKGVEKERSKLALKRSFDDLERRIEETAKIPYSMGFPQVSYVGSCALSAVVTDTFFIVANTGDSQAILVSVEEGKVLSRNLCDVHNSHKEKEQEKLKQSHPNEPDILDKNRVKGRLEPTRAFGDLDLKYKEFDNPENYTEAQGFRPQKPNYSGGYITHEPDLLIQDIDSKDRYLVLATDGLWDLIDPQTAAEIVAEINDPAEAATVLLQKAQIIGAYRFGRAVAEMEEFPPSFRRAMVDDISVVVIQLKKGRN